MIVQALAFYLFAFVTGASGVMVISARNPVHSVLFLIVAFVSSAGLFVLMGAEFLAMILIVVYVGAVAVLFMFVVMMLDINVERSRGGYTGYLPLGLVITGLMVIELMQIIWWRSSADVASGGFVATPDGYSNTEALGAVLYTEHVYAFEIAAVILLLAIVAAVTLTMRKRPGLKRQNISEQVAVKASDRLRIIKMDAEGQE